MNIDSPNLNTSLASYPEINSVAKQYTKKSSDPSISSLATTMVRFGVTFRYEIFGGEYTTLIKFAIHNVGLTDGQLLGLVVGRLLGDCVGSALGRLVGFPFGADDGCDVGLLDGCIVGSQER